MYIDRYDIKLLRVNRNDNDSIILQTKVKESSDKCGFLIRSELADSDRIGEYNTSWVKTFTIDVDADELTPEEVKLVECCAEEVPEEYKDLILDLLNKPSKMTISNNCSKVCINETLLFDMNDIHRMKFPSKHEVELIFKDGKSENFITKKSVQETLKRIYFGNCTSSVTIKE